MGKRVIAYIFIFAFLVSFAALGLTYGGNERAQLNDVRSNIQKNQDALDKGKSEEKNLLNQIKSLEGQMLATQSEIDELKGDIDLTQGKINAALAELRDLEDRLAEQNDYLNARLRAMYMNGSIGVFDVLLGSASIIDL